MSEYRDSEDDVTGAASGISNGVSNIKKGYNDVKKTSNFAKQIYNNRHDLSNFLAKNAKNAVKASAKLAKNAIIATMKLAAPLIGVAFFVVLIVCVCISVISAFVNTDVDEKEVYRLGIENVRAQVQPKYDKLCKKYNLSEENVTVDEVAYTVYMGFSSVDSVLELYEGSYITEEDMEDVSMASGTETFMPWLSKNVNQIVGYNGDSIAVNVSCYRRKDLQTLIKKIAEKDNITTDEAKDQVRELLTTQREQTDEYLKSINVGANTKMLKFVEMSFSNSGDLNADYGENANFYRGTGVYASYWEEMVKRGFYLAAGEIQCVDMARYCLQEVYNLDLSPTGNGNQFAEFLIRKYPDKFESTSEIKAGSFISMNSDGYGTYNPYGHIQYVQKVDGDQIWITEGLPGISSIKFNRRMTMAEVQAQNIVCIASPIE